MRRIPASVATEVTVTFVDGDGVAESATGTVTCAVVDGAGAAVSSGNATDLGGGRYGFTVDLADLDVYAATFSGAFTGDAVRSASTTFEVVGVIPLSVADVRGVDDDLADIVKYPAATVLVEIQAAWDILEQGLRVSIVPRGARVTVDGSGAATLLVDQLELRTVESVSIDGTVVATSDMVVKRGGVIYRPGGWPAGHSNIELHLTHGWSQTPDTVVRALRLLAIDRLVTRATPSRATSVSTDVGAFRLTIAGRDGYTGIPDVDAVIDQFGYAVGFA